MLRPRLIPDRRICRTDFSVYFALLAALFTLLTWATPISFPHQGRSLDLPISSHAVLMSEARREDALQIAILRDGHVFFDTQSVYPEELIAKLRERVRAGAPRRVYIKADGRVRYRAVKGVLDSISSAGLSSVAFITEQRRTAEP